MRTALIALLVSILLVTGCASTVRTVQLGAEARSVPTAPSSPPEAAVKALVPLPGTPELGLVRPTVSVRVTGDGQRDDVGFTSLQKSNAADSLAVVRTDWDGVELWRHVVPVPEGDVEAELSEDPGLGVVSVWFSVGRDDDGVGADTLFAVAGDIHWFDLASGDRGVIPTTHLNGESRSSNMLVGYSFFPLVDGALAEAPSRTVFLGEGGVLRSSDWGSVDGQHLFGSWGGRLWAGWDEEGRGSQLFLDGKFLANFAPGVLYRFFVTEEVFYIVSDKGWIMAKDSSGRTVVAESLACAVGPPWGRVMDGRLMAGSFMADLVSGEGACLDAVIPANHVLAAVGPGEWLFTQPRGVAELADSEGSQLWLGSSDGSVAWERTALESLPMFTEGHVVFQVPEDGDNVVLTAFDVADFEPQR